jgi:uncharacterized protein (UPF0216 family)
MVMAGFDDKNIVKMVQTLNKHLPVERKTLLTLLKEDKPGVQGRNKTVYRIKREELAFIAKLIPKEDYAKLRLPIYIELTPDYGKGIAKVRGKQDSEIVRRILGKEEARDDEILIYRDDVRKLRRKLQTTTQYTFSYSMSF